MRSARTSIGGEESSRDGNASVQTRQLRTNSFEEPSDFGKATADALAAGPVVSPALPHMLNQTPIMGGSTNERSSASECGLVTRGLRTCSLDATAFSTPVVDDNVATVAESADSEAGDKDTSADQPKETTAALAKTTPTPAMPAQVIADDEARLVWGGGPPPPPLLSLGTRSQLDRATSRQSVEIDGPSGSSSEL